LNLQVLPPTLPPASSPCCKDNKKGCELTTFGASQIGSLVALIIVLVATSLRAVRLLPSGTEASLVDQYLLFLGCSIVYFFVGCWVLEVDYVDFLRSLVRPVNILEFIVRLTILIYLAFFGFIVDHMSAWVQLHFPSLSNPVLLALCAFLIVLYCAFLLWDGLILFAIYLGRNRGSVPMLTIITSPGDDARSSLPANRVLWGVVAYDVVGLAIAALLFWAALYPTSGIARLAWLFVIIGILVYMYLLFYRALPVFVDDPGFTSDRFGRHRGIPFAFLIACGALLSRCLIRSRLK
jgi:hypothetical protein